MSELMNTYDRILVAVDFGPETDKILTKAKCLSTSCGAKLDLLNIVHTHRVPVMEGFSDIGIGNWNIHVADELEVESEDRIKDLAQQYGIDNYHVVQGNPGATIVEYANHNHIDLLIMGSHNHSTLHKLTGSTIEKVMNEANCDLFLIRCTVD